MTLRNAFHRGTAQAVLTALAWHCVAVLACLNASAADAEADVPTMIRRLEKGKEKPVRLAAIKSLGDSEDERCLEATELLSQMFRGEDDVDLRSQAIIALGLMHERHGKVCPAVIVDAMFDDDDLIRTNASAIVGLFKNRLPEGAVPRLLDRAADRDAHLRSNVLTILADNAQGNPIVVALLKQAAYDQSRLVRNNAVAGLWRATKDLSLVVPHRLILLDSPAPDGASAEEKSLAELHAIASAHQIREWTLKHPRRMVDVLLPLLKDDSPTIRGAAARTLGAGASQSAKFQRAAVMADATRRLEELLEDPDDKVRMNAAVGMAAFSD